MQRPRMREHDVTRTAGELDDTYRDAVGIMI
jgi:hypothetical protein